MRRLYLQIYLGFIAVLVGVSLIGGALFWLELRHRNDPKFLTAIAERIAVAVPPAGAAGSALEAALEAQGEEFGVNLIVWGAAGERLAAVGPRWGLPRFRQRGQLRGMRFEGTLYELGDGRWLGLRVRRERGHGFPGWLAVLGALALGAYPIARRIAGRLERLRAGVDVFGAGALSARVKVEGRDEVADLARSFNSAADRIETLVTGQRRMLASASHELRSPLARLRVAVELLTRDQDGELSREAERDIEELDALIEDILLAARLQSGQRPAADDEVDLWSLLVDEAARVGATVEGSPCHVLGDAKLMRRLLRNLLENAHRHGNGSEIEAAVVQTETGARITVSDRGPGVPESERERIFEPFYRPEGHSEGEHGGVGLGLALVREIARLHGGDAICTARAGGGTHFEVALGA